MLNKFYLPSLGFVILSITIVCSILFIQWVAGPYNYEVALSAERKGHKLAKLKNLQEAKKYFLKAANINDINTSRSNRYMWTASVSINKEDKIKFYTLALKYNNNNQVATKRLKNLLKKKSNE